MVIKKLFLCHPRGAADDVHRLADALRLRGIVPWVDQQGGFSLGDAQIDEARRVIREECFGLLLYATEDAFTSDFIRRVELHEAIQVHDDDAAFALFALPRRIEFDELSRLSIETFGVDLANFASRRLAAPGVNVEGVALDELFAGIAADLTQKVLRSDARRGDPTLQLQYSTRERLADEPEDTLCIDATHLFSAEHGAVADDEQWARLHAALRDVKQAVASCRGRPRLRVHGSKHLTAAYLFGYAFPSTAFELDLRTRNGYWSTDHPPSSAVILRSELRGGSAASDRLHIELSTLDQPVHDAVRRYIQRAGQSPLATLRLSIDPANYGGVMGNAEACAIADQVRREIAKTVSQQPVAEIHLFAAVPQALATMIGRRFNTLPPIQLYEYSGREYQPSYSLR